jgi:Rieske Fe-S protein
MAVCALCGNDYDKSFQVTLADTTLTFDSFECAIHLLAPTCSHCGCRIIGHGVEADGVLYCCAHCAKQSGESRLRDRV